MGGKPNVMTNLRKLCHNTDRSCLSSRSECHVGVYPGRPEVQFSSGLNFLFVFIWERGVRAAMVHMDV